MSSLQRSWAWRTDDFVLDHEHGRQPSLCLDSNGDARVAWLHDTEVLRGGRRQVEVRCAEVAGNEATVRTQATSREPVLQPRAVWTSHGLETFVLAASKGRRAVCVPGRMEKWHAVFEAERDVLSFDVAANGDGPLAFAYQTRLGRGFQVHLKIGLEGRPFEVGSPNASKWRPLLIPSHEGRFWVAWEAFHAGQFRVFARQVFPDGGLGPVLAVPTDDRFGLDAAGDVDRYGHLWLACRSAEPWGVESHFLNADAKLLLSCIATDRVLSTFAIPIPEDPDHVKLPASPTVLCHHDGSVSVFFRWFRNAIPNDWGWDINQTTLRDGEWSDVVKVTTSIGNSDERVCVAGLDDRLWLAYQTCVYDGHRDPSHAASIRLKRLNQPELASRLRGKTEQAATQVTVISAKVSACRPLGEPRAGAVLLGNTELSPFWGDLHRHTNLSKCISENDGTFGDHYRWAIETAALDFYAVTDHYSYINADDWAECVRAAEVYNADGLFTALIGYEWHHQGHANLYFADETTAGRVWRDHAGLRTFEELYAAFDRDHLRRKVMAIRHYHADAMLASAQSFAHSVNRDYESAAEVIQTRGVSPKAYEWLLSHGCRLGCVGASDHSRPGHSGTANPYVYAAALTGIFAENLSRDSVLDAIRRRRTFATNGKKMAVWLSIDDIFMGGEGVVSQEPAVAVHADATTTIDHVEVIRDGQTLSDRAESGESVEFVFTDDDVPPGDHYYYVKVRQKPDDVHKYPGIAWSSPVWVTVEG